MRYAPTLAFAGAAAASAIGRRAVKSFPAGTSFDIVLNSADITLSDMQNAPGSVISIDLEDNEDIIPTLAKTKTVLCYFSAGSRETWRSDADKFATSDVGQQMFGNWDGGIWEGENWINVKSANILSIMTARIERARKAGCHGIDPDNVDGYNGDQDGFGYDKSAYITYIKSLAKVASDKGLAIGLKNALEILDDVKDVVQFAVNEQCHEWTECDDYAEFTTKDDKAVFNIEYKLKSCPAPTAGTKLSTILKDEKQELRALGGFCPN